METFGARLKRLRESRGWSQQELATRAEVPYMTIYRAERAINQEPRMSVAVKLARALGVTLDYLGGMYDEERRQQAPPDAQPATQPSRRRKRQAAPVA